MLYLLGGSARAGKTRIAGQFLRKTGIPFFSLDFLMMGIANGLPALDFNPEVDELLVAEQLGPIVRAMAVAIIEEEIDYLLEGVQLHPAHVNELRAEYPSQTRACFIGFAEANVRAKLNETRRYGGGADDWMRTYSDEGVVKEIDRLRELSARVRRLCREHGLPYVEASETEGETGAQVIEHLLERFPTG